MRRNIRIILLIVIIIFSFLNLASRENKTLPQQHENIFHEEEVFYGKVTGPATIGENLIHYPFEIIKVNQEELDNKLNVRLSKNISKFDTDSSYYPGDLLKLKGTLQEVPTATNPGEFDYKKYLENRGKNYLIYPAEIKILDSEINIFRPGLKVSDYFKNILEENLSPGAYGWVKAVTLGDTSGLREFDESNLYAAGGGHIAAVSGMHLSIIGLGFFYLFTKKGLQKKYAAAITLMIIWFYVTMVGPRPSVLRAGIMLTIFILSEAFGSRKYRLSSFDSLLLAFVFLLLLYPGYLFDIGFQLSFSATFFILFLFPIFSEKIKLNINVIKVFLEPVKVACAALIGVFPLLMYYFGYASLGSILISPFIAFILPLLFILTFFGQLLILLFPFAEIVFSLIDFLCLYLSNMFQVAAKISPRLEESWSVFHIVGYYGGIFSLVYILKSSLALAKLRCAYMSFFIFVGIFIFSSIGPYLGTYLEKGELEAVFLDIGHGDSIYINTPAGSNILIDGGGVYDESPRRDPGESILVPFLKHEGVDKIDVMVATHPHVDHFGGLREIVKNIEVGTVVLPDLSNDTSEYLEFLELINDRDLQKLVVRERMRFYPEENLKFEILHPDLPYLMGTGSDLNNNSVVIRLVYKDASFLFTGDLEKEGERRLLRDGVNLESKVLKIGHHGSSSSSTLDFLREVSPMIAVISAGRDSPYGFPSPEVLNRLEEKNIVAIRTDEWGATKIVSNGQGFRIDTYLEEKIR